MLQRPGNPGAVTAAIQEGLQRALHHLPSQAPLQSFVHHNTLHAFEESPFENAVIEAAWLYKSQPFQSEKVFHEQLRSGRIKLTDISNILSAESTAFDQRALFPGGPSRYDFRIHRLVNELPEVTSESVPWRLAETDLLSQLFDPGWAALDGYPIATSDLPLLWSNLESVASGEATRAPRMRLRDVLYHRTFVDTDALVHPFLIRFTAAYLDQGVSYWRFPLHSHGFLNAFVSLYARSFSGARDWRQGFDDCLLEIQSSNLTASEVVHYSLKRLEVDLDFYGPYITATLLSLRGWAGMVHMMEQHPEKMPGSAPSVCLLDYLAVQLLLDLQAARYVISQELPAGTTIRSLSENHSASDVPALPEEKIDLKSVYEAFLMAQILGVDPGLLARSSSARVFLQQVVQFDSYSRRRILHLAYERRHRIRVLDGLYAHLRLGTKTPDRSDFQAIFCIDDREESLRRHLEEVRPRCETLSYAGFFGVAMQYQGLDDVRPRPLCPVAIHPVHLVREVTVTEAENNQYVARKRRVGRRSLAAHVGGVSLLRGAVMTQVLGCFYLIPLLLKTLFPRYGARIQRLFNLLVTKPPATRLLLERAVDEDAIDGLYHGYTTEEMTAIVENALRSMGLTGCFAKLVFVVGHGSSSKNNPHCAAYGCGATGGGKGGPNARAFASMANHPEVRAGLHKRGLLIPATTWFVGAYHNTCDDAMEYYDLDLVPEPLWSDLQSSRDTFAVAILRDAQERCRKFASASPAIVPQEAQKHVETRANDLAQPRPECGHATNSLCVIGRRKLSRGLFLDRRAFLASYVPSADQKGELLAALMRAVVPVCAGINLEYYFSYIDPDIYGCGSKLPHNVTGLFGVMDGHCSDLRTGLPWQMVELHEPVRLLTIVEAEVQTVLSVLQREQEVRRLVANGWIQLVTVSPSSGELYEYRKGRFVHYVPEQPTVPVFKTSQAFYQDKRECLPCARVEASFEG